MEPRKRYRRGEPSVLQCGGPCCCPVKAWDSGPAGVGELGIGARGFPRNLGDPTVSTDMRRGAAAAKAPGPAAGVGPRGSEHRRTSGNRQAKETKAGGKGGRESERLVVPWKPGNPTARTR